MTRLPYALAIMASAADAPLQGAFLALWNALCGILILKNWSLATQVDRRLLVLYFEPYVPFCVMLGLWAVNLRVFERLKIPYEKLFAAEDQKYLLKGEQIGMVAAWLGTALMTVIALYLSASAAQVRSVVQWLPAAFLVMMVIALLWPMPSSLRQSHAFFSRTLCRVVMPFQSVSFADFLLADVLTSLARSLGDLERTCCYMTIPATSSLKQLEKRLEGQCGRGAVHTNAFIAAPYLIRMIQCLRIYGADGDAAQLFNAVKYLTVVPVIVSSVMKHHAYDDQMRSFWRSVWFMASVINTSYSYYWDVERDWDVAWCRKRERGGVMPTLPAETLYSPKWLYLVAMATNFVIRIVWIYKLSVHLHYSWAMHIIVALLEVFRRFQWIFIRVECGLRKMTISEPTKAVSPGPYRA